MARSGSGTAGSLLAAMVLAAMTLAAAVVAGCGLVDAPAGKDQAPRKATPDAAATEAPPGPRTRSASSKAVR